MKYSDDDILTTGAIGIICSLVSGVIIAVGAIANMPHLFILGVLGLLSVPVLALVAVFQLLIEVLSDG